MSTTSNPTQPITDAEVESYIRQIAAEEAGKSGNNPQPTVTKPTESIKMNIGGQEMSFDNLEAVQAHYNNTIGQFQSQLNSRQPERKVTSDADDSTDKYDQKRFVELMVEDARKAYDYVDKFRYGMDDPVAAIKSNLGQINQLATQAVVKEFQDRNTDWEPNEHNAAAMQKIMNEMALPLSPSALEAAYAVAQKRGVLKNAPKPEQINRNENNPYLMAPPVASRNNSTAATASDPWGDLETMPMGDLEKLVQRVSNR